MGVNYYLSTDASAPTLTGEVGSLTNLLDKCLVDGYGSKAPLGWAAPFSATNRRAYRAPAGNRHCLQVDDDARTPSAAASAKLTAWETLAGFDDGQHRYGNPVHVIFKSLTANATQRHWCLVGDDRAFYFFPSPDTGITKPAFFGDLLSLIDPDPFCSAIMAPDDDGGSITISLDFAELNSSFGVSANRYISRRYNLIPGHANIGFCGVSPPVGASVQMGGSAFTFPYPTPANNGLAVSPPVLVYEQASPGVVLRATMPGLRYPLHNRPLADWTTISGIESLPGRTLIAAGSTSVFSANTGQVLIDITGPWR